MCKEVKETQSNIYKSKYKNTNIKDQDSITPQKHHKNATTEPQNIELDEICDRKYRRLWLKIINDLKACSHEHINEVRKSIQDLDNRLKKMDEKFSKEMDIMEENHK
jgi:hypothetical protein